MKIFKHAWGPFFRGHSVYTCAIPDKTNTNYSIHFSSMPQLRRQKLQQPKSVLQHNAPMHLVYMAPSILVLPLEAFCC